MSRCLLLGVALLLSACASIPAAPSAAHPDGARVDGFSFATDPCPFPTDIRARHPDRDALYANYCFVLARGVRQFHRFARFEPAAPKLDHEGYIDRVRTLAARAPWEPPAADEARVVIPGYANLRDFSRAQEGAVEVGLCGRLSTLVHSSNLSGS